MGGRSYSDVHCKPIGSIVEKWILEVDICGHVRDCHVLDAEIRMDQGRRVADGKENVHIGVYSNVGE